jgi:hypothetical protein
MTYGAKLAFSFMQPVFDEDRKDWEEISKKNSDNAKERWKKMNANISYDMRPHTTAYEHMRASTDIGIDSVSVIGIDINNTDIVTKEPNEYQKSIQYLKAFDINSDIPDYAENYRDEWIKFCIYWSEK